ncbi:hypothetical protein QTG56_16160 [Rossellomorea sp. AcN35-11]|nr:hypothetical protein [Rossellomorea aquimaris]WJV28589.1 hypothetical protein QTG56_16160 [Rossellomorea sp. AcN35-11]
MLFLTERFQAGNTSAHRSWFVMLLKRLLLDEPANEGGVQITQNSRRDSAESS